VWRWTVTAGVEVARRLWDSWEDDAVIRDVATGRFVDRDKLHYIDFVGRYFSVKGPSITPRPPQGQPVVAALAHAKPIYEFAARSTDLVFITPSDDGSLKSIIEEVTQPGGTELKVYADVFVTFSGVTDPRSDALVFDGAPAELAELILWRVPAVGGAGRTVCGGVRRRRRRRRHPGRASPGIELRTLGVLDSCG
jgi:alkanesulfonate monooxygenase SsuD/methylene tetrahydromethanopterin reductase-like flavin-dependent oxidoreductase (luciferase family)